MLISGSSSEAVTELVRVLTQSQYISEQSRPQNQHYFFAYTIVISNEGPNPAQLKSRHWIIQDGKGKIKEVKGPGVVGEYPRLEEGETYKYTSFCVLETPMGSMRGSYQFTRDDGDKFDVAIAEFRLLTPAILN